MPKTKPASAGLVIVMGLEAPYRRNLVRLPHPHAAGPVKQMRLIG